MHSDNASDELVTEYRLGRSVEEPAAVPDIFVLGPRRRQEAELSDSGSGEALLRRIAAFTGGRFNPRPAVAILPTGIDRL